jgi:saccharopine dehydrogenase-like NADP-dependent oxidoreductase
MNIIVLGAGLVGGPMAIDLAADHSFDVTGQSRQFPGSDQQSDFKAKSKTYPKRQPCRP